ncbi:hypothetical protein HA402_002514 [Bradysia odoriphaga]|nr:hypothetical protein HA402_002514 [Bradysia odoriphaga]
MTYSNPKEVGTLKRKLEQVSQFGCEAFALLFDDIETEMSKADKEVFQTFAHAQVSVTNEIFKHLNCTNFLFCPTQYCSTRAVPTVSNSEYLNTLGNKLMQEIDILWTGPKVISKYLTIESIQEITEVLRRKPVIWDNLHANDYDQKRVFLGPYSGRSPELIPLLRGVLTNPNCEFHANTIAIHTLAHWSKCNSDTKIHNSISADIKLETESEDGAYAEEAPVCLSKNVYHPRIALKNAIDDWLPDFFQSKEAYGPISKPHPAVTMVMPVIPIIPSVNTCMSLTTQTTITTSTSAIKVLETNQLQALAEVCSVVTGSDPITLPNVVMNSLVSTTKIVTNDAIPNPIVSTVSNSALPSIPVPVSSIGIPLPIMAMKDDYDTSQTDEEKIIDDGNKNLNNAGDNQDEETEAMPVEDEPTESVDDISKMKPPNNGELMADDSYPLTEPMECTASPRHTQKCASEDVVMSENVSTSSSAGSMQEGSDTSLQSNAEMVEDSEVPFDKTITASDIALLCDLFYLPFEHGNRALQLLNEFNWLKSNACVLSGYKRKSDLGLAKPEVQEWFQRSEKFYALGQMVMLLAKKLADCTNRELCYELFSYVWDVTGVITLLTGFVKWLALGHFPANINSYTQGNYTWFSKGWRDTFSSGDQEPWVFRGGLIADLQRLIPVDSGNDLFLYKLPDVPTNSFHAIRPYNHIDEPKVYTICHASCRDGSDCTELFPEHLQSIPADRLLGPFLTLNPELCLVMEDSKTDLIGYACAALDAKLFYRNQEMCWLPAMCSKYPMSLLNSTEGLTQAAIDSINHFHKFKYDCPLEVLTSHPSIMTCCVLKDHFTSDHSTAKRLVTVLLAALRSNGASGVHVCINLTDRFMHQFYSKLGFVEIHRDPNGKVYLGRNF